MISDDIKLRNKLARIRKQHSEVIDIILFGSAVRGKERPNDVDVLVLFEDKIDKEVEYMIRKELEKSSKGIAIISKTKRTLVEDSFDARESIFCEGKSLLDRRNLAADYGFTSFGMFKYDFRRWDKLMKTKFYYALNGRSSKKGVADALNCIKLSDSLILAPLEHIEEFREFLESWKLPYLYTPALIPKRMARKQILER
ncbi:nucleotidyltransferase domain-containing protein [Candidatus Woesearchaeota archaeon]|nr:nucleotidyltransferase domain-containing protein [Candidatus Woesearchaeota archaeon]